jgi:hypothetical protein
MTKVKVFTDKVEVFKKAYPGVDIEPVDAYGNFVPLDKFASDNLDNMENSIQDNFDLQQDGIVEVPEQFTEEQKLAAESRQAVNQKGAEKIN